nr:hypothetical protein [uncultured Treponema sp.]
MTKDELFFLLESRREFEFSYKDTIYSIMCEKDFSGKEFIKFGKLYFEEKFDSFNDLFARAEVENSYLREVIEEIQINRK